MPFALRDPDRTRSIETLMTSSSWQQRKACRSKAFSGKLGRERGELGAGRAHDELVGGLEDGDHLVDGGDLFLFVKGPQFSDAFGAKQHDSGVSGLQGCW